MLARFAFQCWLSGLNSRQQVLSTTSTHSSYLSCSIFGITVLPQLAASQHQGSSFHNSCSSSSSQQPPEQTDSQPSQAAEPHSSNQNSQSTTSATDADAAAAPPTQQAQELPQQQAGPSTQVFTTLSARMTPTGYQETYLASTGSSVADQQASGALLQALPEEKLRIQLRQEIKHVQETEELDAYTLSRSLVGADAGPKPAAAAAAVSDPQQQQQQQLTAADKELLEKLVGIMTKDGKKSRARRQLLDAMHIIKQQLAQGKNAA